MFVVELTLNTNNNSSVISDHIVIKNFLFFNNGQVGFNTNSLRLLGIRTPEGLSLLKTGRDTKSENYDYSAFS